MKRLSWALCAVLGLAPCAAVAQTPPDATALARTVQKLSQRVDRLEKDRDRLQKQLSGLSGVPTATASPAASPLPPPPKSSPKNVSVPGWEVEVVPSEDPGKDAVANFDYKEPTFDFSLHTQLVDGHNPYTYKGTGYLHIREPGRYVISLTLEPLRTSTGWNYACVGNVKINGEPLVEGRADANAVSGDWNRKGELSTKATFSGGSELQPPDPSQPKKAYTLTFQVGCYANERDKALLPDSEFRHWQDNRFTILIKGPHDPKGRAFKSNELYHGGEVAQP